MLFTALLFTAVPFFIRPRRSCPGMSLLTMSRALPHQSLIKKNAPQTCPQATLMEAVFFFFSWGSLLPNDQNCVKLTDSPAQTVFLSFWEEFCHHSRSLVANFSFVPWKLDFLGLRALTLPRLFIQELPQPTLFQLLWPSQQQQKVCLYGVKLQLFSSLP